MHLVRQEEQFNFQKVTLEEVEEILLNLPRKTSAGDDQISYIEIKDASHYVTPMLNAIVNLIIETSHWPKVWSNSIIKPLYKGEGDIHDASCYRPVALTCCLSHGEVACSSVDRISPEEQINPR